METKNIKCYKGYNYIENVQFFNVSIISLLTILHEFFKNNSKDKIIETINESTIVDSCIMYESLSKKFNNNKDLINEFLVLINTFGFGSVTLSKISKKRVVFIQKKYSFGKLYFKMFGKKPKYSYIGFNCGFFKNFLSNVFKKNIDVSYKLVGDDLVFVCDILEDNYGCRCGLGIALPKNLKNYKESIDTNLKVKLNLNGKNYFENYLLILFPIRTYLTFASISNVYREFKHSTGFSIGKIYYGVTNTKNISDINLKFKALIKILIITGFGEIKILNKNHSKISILTDFEKCFDNSYQKINIEHLKNFIFAVYKGFHDSVYDVSTEMICTDNEMVLKKISNNYNVNDLDKILIKNARLKL